MAAAPGAYIGVTTSAVGAAFGAYSAWQSAKSAKQALQSQAELADINARVSELSATTALAAGQKQESAVRMRTGHLKSAQRAGLAANGVDLGTGSAANILTDTDLMGEADANTAAINTLQSAWGYQTQAQNSRTSANMGRATANGMSAGGAAASSLLSSAPLVAQSWYAANRTVKGEA